MDAGLDITETTGGDDCIGKTFEFTMQVGQKTRLDDSGPPLEDFI